MGRETALKETWTRRIMTVIVACLLVLPGGLVAGLAAAEAKAARNASGQLVIGITQFPSTFHPNINSMLATTYILALTRRPFTTFDADWKLICMLCVTLPSIENGLAVPEKTAKGQQGIAVTYTIREDAFWGDGKPVSTEDVVFTWKVGRNKKTGVSNSEF